jgi:hypothetical protein
MYRVRLGEFSPIGWLFNLGKFMIYYRSSRNLLATFFHGISYAQILTKKCVGPHFGRFFKTHLFTLIMEYAFVLPRPE